MSEVIREREESSSSEMDRFSGLLMVSSPSASVASGAYWEELGLALENGMERRGQRAKGGEGTAP